MARRVLIVVVAALVASLLAAIPTAHASSPGWITFCPANHQAMDDPIVYPRQPGASHHHVFFGNRSTNAFSTYRSMRHAHTSCRIKSDKAGYWVPALFEDGRYVSPRGRLADGSRTRQVFYYRVDNVSARYRARHPVEPFPPNFRLIAGNAHAHSVRDNPALGEEIYWGCSDNSTDKLIVPPSCDSGAISLHVGFPNCWNGKVTKQNDTANVVYPDDGSCPRKYPRLLPRLIFRFEYPVGTTTGDITLASGPSYTMHGDFWNTWNQRVLSRLVRTCLGADVDCGNNPK
jgi:hypothetical protein